jgi:hypothetical protein
MTPAEMREINQKLRQAIESEGGLARIEGQWWQFSLTARTEKEPAALSLLKIARNRDGALELSGRSWRSDGRLCARYWSEASREKEESSGFFYYWNGERPLEADAPQLYGTGEIKLETEDRANGFFTTRSDSDPSLNARTVGVYWRAGADDIDILDGRDDQRRAALISARLKEWESVRNG